MYGIGFGACGQIVKTESQKVKMYISGMYTV